MQKKELIYSGKAKNIYATDHADQVVIEFRDDATAFNGAKHTLLHHKGIVNNYFNAFFMQQLAHAGIENHFIQLLNDRETLTKKLTIIPVECVVRNIAAGNLAKRLGIKEGTELTPPIFEFYYKSDALNDPFINEYHIRTLKWASEKEVHQLQALSFKVNDILRPLFNNCGFLLVDFKLEFGRFHNELLLGDEFTLDGCRVWDSKTKEIYDKDRFRRDLGDVTEHYIIAAKRLGIKIPI